MKLLGDVFLDKSYKVDLELDEYIFNLEYALSTSGIPARNKINLGVDTPNILETFNKFPIAVNLANNHIMDYGEEAFNTTINYLHENNIGYFGAGNTENNFNNPYIYQDKDNQKIAFFGYSCPSTHPVFGSDTTNGSALLDIEKIILEIKRYTNLGNFIVVNLHWGDEEIIYPKASDVEIAHRLIDAGVDLIVGHHAHVIQSIEKYKNKYIFYGVGNFIFPDFDVPCSYDGELFLARSTKQQLSSNKQTLIIDLDSSLTVSYETAIFEKGIVKEKKLTTPTWIPKKQKHYDLYKKVWTKRRMIEIFLRNPRFPTIKQIKLLFGIKF